MASDHGSGVYLVILLAGLGLPACGGGNGSATDAAPNEQDASACATDPRASPYTPGLTRPSQHGKFVAQLQKSDPAPPAKGDNTWDIRLVDATGEPVEGARIDVMPFMPDHGHGTSIDAVVTPASSGGGQYSISPINLWMPGLWQVTLRAEADGVTDDVVFGFCIAG
jgi:hypothetical protein